MYIASSLENKNKSVSLKNFAMYTDEEAIEELQESKIFGITVTSMEIPFANTFAKKIKKKFPNSAIVLGGPGIYDKEVCYWLIDEIDSVCIGEGEITVFEILYDKENKKLQRVYYGKTTLNLNELPLPARHLLKNKQGGNIFAYDHKYLGEESTVIISSRGCPYRCSFCSAPGLNKFGSMRFRSNDSVVSEIKFVIDNYGIRQFRFSDDSFTANKKRLLSLCEQLKDLNIIWRISCRVKPIDKEMLQSLWKAGCRELSFGIESFDDEVLLGLQKGTTCQDNVYALNLAFEIGFKTRMLFMIRTPFQTKRTIDMNKFWIEKVPFTIMSCTSFIPIPGSDIWLNPDKYNIEILNTDMEKYNFYMFGSEGKKALDPIIRIKDRSLEEFMQESEEFRTWISSLNKVNKG
jgi:radical SAM superfamily enzyme YgiQ (UPF0313 family)